MKFSAAASQGMFISLPAAIASLTFPGNRTTILGLWILCLLVCITMAFALRVWRQPTASVSFGTGDRGGSRFPSRPADLKKLEGIVRDGYDVREFDSRLRPLLLNLAQQQGPERFSHPEATLPLLMSDSSTAIYDGRVSIEGIESLLDQLEEAAE